MNSENMSGLRGAYFITISNNSRKRTSMRKPNWRSARFINRTKDDTVTAIHKKNFRRLYY